MSKMKKIVCNSLEDVVKPNIVYNLAKLSQYANVKDPVPQKYKSDLVRECRCPEMDCNELYKGETEAIRGTHYRSQNLLINVSKPSSKKHNKSFSLKLFNI